MHGCLMTEYSSDMKTGLGFGVLGPLTVTRLGEPLPLGGRQQKAVLARLLVERNCTVSMDRLADALWGERVPDGWVATIQTYVSHLREALEPERPRGAPPRVLLTDNGGYRLRVEDEAVEAGRFEQLAAAGRACLAKGRFAEVGAELAEALSLWRGAVLADLVDYDFARETAGYLDGLHAAAIEARVDADLALGRHDQLAVELGRLVALHPLRERLHGQHILALYRCGQQSDALAAYQLLRDTLADELGIDPSPQLQKLYQSVLGQSPELGWREPPGLPASSQPNTDAVQASKGDALARRSRGAPRRWVVVLVSALTAAATVVTGTVLVARRSSPATLSGLPPNSAGSIDSSGGLRGAVAVGQSPEGLAYGAGALWVTNMSDQTVSHIDISSQRVSQRIVVGASPNAITVTGDNVWWSTAARAPSRGSTRRQRLLSTPSGSVICRPRLQVGRAVYEWPTAAMTQSSTSTRNRERSGQRFKSAGGLPASRWVSTRSG
jgi:DNA-binding SARP family transcriptional activator